MQLYVFDKDGINRSNTSKPQNGRMRGNMLELGQVQTLEVVKKAEQGIYLGTMAERVLLPKKEVPDGIQIGDKLEIFLYRDSKDRLICTRCKPILTLGQMGVLTVKEIGKIGAFLDWGLEKDLFLPYKEQTYQVQAGDQILAAVYIDKSNRLCATMRVYPYLETTDQYQKDSVVTGRVYEMIESFGAFVAVEDRYKGLIPKKEVHRTLKAGDVITARVTAVKPDGKLDLSVQKKAYLQLEEDAELIYNGILEFAGVLPYTDKVSPEIIEKDFGMSKNAFKRGIGRLLKQGRVEIGEKSIRIIK